MHFGISAILFRLVLMDVLVLGACILMMCVLLILSILGVNALRLANICVVWISTISFLGIVVTWVRG